MTSELQGLVSPKSPSVAKKSIRDVLFQYLAYWPVFLISVTLFLGGAYAYLRYSTPLYSGNTVINVKGETTTGRGAQQSGDLITAAMQGGKSVINLDNELGRLRSARLMTQVVRNSDLNVSYYREGAITKTDIYHAAPFRLLQVDLQDSSRKAVFSVTKCTNAGFTLAYGDENNRTTKNTSWNQNFTINGNTYTLTPLMGINPADKYVVEWSPVQMAVYELMPKVGVNVIGKTNNIALGITIENPDRGEDVLDRMVAQFIQMNLDDQNRNAQDKIYFIKDRLAKLSQQLDSSERDLASAKGTNLTAGGGEVYGTSVGAAQMGQDQINVQKSTLNIIRRNLLASDGNATIPSGGATDPTLGTLIGQYNQVVTKKAQQASQLAAGSLLLKDLDQQIATLRDNILTSLEANMAALSLQSGNFARQGALNRQSVSRLPEVERIVNQIARGTKITEQLYIYLLQEREKTELSKTTTSPYEQIDPATSYGPVSPNGKSIYLYAILLGLIVPAVVVFLIAMINDKVSSREEIESTVEAQIVGEIGNVRRTEDKLIPALRGGVVGEQFRIMRANFNFLHKASEAQTILITSSASGEGKSFISLNLAAVLAKTGKRVALLEFDLRKPPESPLPIFHGRGLKDYLMGEVTIDEIGQPIGELPNLHVYPTGEIVSEAGDLIVSDRMDQLFAELRQRYDAIVVNTPPVGLVGDALVLQKHSNIVGYVIRQGFTRKRQLAFFNSLVETGKFKNAAIVFNGVRTGVKYGYYGYGYTEKTNPYFDRDGNNKNSAASRVFRKRKKESAAS